MLALIGKGLVTSVLLGSLFVTPQHIHAEQILMMSEKKAAIIGEKMYEELTAQIPVLSDKRITDYVNKVGHNIASHSDEPDDQYTFTVLDSPEINAFATPGGYVYINRGLLAHMNSESQLAAVLGHEVAHITAEHAASQQLAQTGTSIVASILAIFTRSNEVGEATAQWGAASLKGYGRDMELEADALGNKFLNRAGYDPDAMIAIISQLKAHERFTKKRSVDAGKKVQTYHGLFASHPRNDKRLREMLKLSASEDGQIDNKIATNVDRGSFRVATNGLVWGNNSSQKEKNPNRFYHDKLRFQFDYPEGWAFKDQGLVIKGQNEKQSTTLNVDIKARTLNSPRDFIKKNLGIAFIKKSEGLLIHGLKAHTGIVPAIKGAGEQRLIVIYYGRRAYIFRGEVSNASLSDKPDAESKQSYDRSFLTIASSFKPRSIRELQNQTPLAIYYVKAKAGATYARLAQHLGLERYGVDQLRLINGDYPRGEPITGQWIKIIR